MRLTQLDGSNNAEKALKSNFDFNLDVSKLNKLQTRQMLVKFSNVIKEAKKKGSYDSHKNPSYLKALMIAEALTAHYKNFSNNSIIVENTEVEKSQCILAAQDLVDQVQKMLEQTNNMLVKELPALTDSMQSEIGVAESQAYGQSANESLTQLNQTLSQVRASLNEALNTLTGQGAGDFGASGNGGAEAAVTDVAAGGTAPDMAAPDATAASAAPEAPPAEEPEGGAVGRAKR
jgi:hypothetical protein